MSAPAGDEANESDAFVARSAHSGGACFCSSGCARHLADPAQSLERRLDRDADGAARSAARHAAAAATWPDLDQTGEEYRRVDIQRRHSTPPRKRWSSPPLRPSAPTCPVPAIWVFTPARLADGSVVIVNRGFIPEGRQDPKIACRTGRIRESVEIVGVDALAGRPPLVHAERRPGAQPVVRPRPAPIAGAKELGSGRAVLRRAGIAGAAGGLPQPGKLVVQTAQQPPAIRGDLVRLGASFWPWCSSYGPSNPAGSRSEPVAAAQRLRLPCEALRFSISVASVRPGGRVPPAAKHLGKSIS